MERMTQWFGTGEDRAAGLVPEHRERYTTDELIDVLLDKLARYEDTGLMPEQIEAIQEENAKLTTPDTVRIRHMERITKQVEEHGGVDHLIGLDILAYMGRLAILPCKITDPIWLIESVFNVRKCTEEKITPARIDHFTIGEKGVPVIDACTDDGLWYTSLEPGDYYLTPEMAQAVIDEGDTNVDAW